MKSTRLAAAGALTIVLIAIPCFAQVAEATTFVGCPADWTFVGAPTVGSLGISRAVTTTFKNHLDVSVLGVVILVLHNDRGQTVYYSTATLNITRGLYGTAYLVEAGVAPGVYNATIFAISPSGVAISNSTTISFPAR